MKIIKLRTLNQMFVLLAHQPQYSVGPGRCVQQFMLVLYYFYAIFD